MKYVGYVFGGDVLRFFHGGDECLTIPSSWTVETAHKYKITFRRTSDQVLFDFLVL